MAKGCLFLFSPKEMGKRFTDWWFNASPKTHRACGVAILSLGILVLASLSPLIK